MSAIVLIVAATVAVAWVLHPVTGGAPPVAAGGAPRCPSCGPRPEGDAKYCSNCGAPTTR